MGDKTKDGGHISAAGSSGDSQDVPDSVLSMLQGPSKTDPGRVKKFLLEFIFSDSERILCNTRGSLGCGQLNKEKLGKLQQAFFRVFRVLESEKEREWESYCRYIDEAGDLLRKEHYRVSDELVQRWTQECGHDRSLIIRALTRHVLNDNEIVFSNSAGTNGFQSLPKHKLDILRDAFFRISKLLYPSKEEEWALCCKQIDIQACDRRKEYMEKLFPGFESDPVSAEPREVEQTTGRHVTCQEMEVLEVQSVQDSDQSSSSADNSMDIQIKEVSEVKVLSASEIEECGRTEPKHVPVQETSTQLGGSDTNATKGECTIADLIVESNMARTKRPLTDDGGRSAKKQRNSTPLEPSVFSRQNITPHNTQVQPVKDGPGNSLPLHSQLSAGNAKHLPGNIVMSTPIKVEPAPYPGQEAFQVGPNAVSKAGMCTFIPAPCTSAPRSGSPYVVHYPSSNTQLAHPQSSTPVNNSSYPVYTSPQIQQQQQFIYANTPHGYVLCAPNVQVNRQNAMPQPLIVGNPTGSPIMQSWNGPNAPYAQQFNVPVIQSGGLQTTSLPVSAQGPITGSGNIIQDAPIQGMNRGLASGGVAAINIAVPTSVQSWIVVNPSTGTTLTEPGLQRKYTVGELMATSSSGPKVLSQEKDSSEEQASLEDVRNESGVKKAKRQKADDVLVKSLQDVTGHKLFVVLKLLQHCVGSREPLDLTSFMLDDKQNKRFEGLYTRVYNKEYPSEISSKECRDLLRNLRTFKLHKFGRKEAERVHEAVKSLSSIGLAPSQKVNRLAAVLFSEDERTFCSTTGQINRRFCKSRMFVLCHAFFASIKCPWVMQNQEKAKVKAILDSTARDKRQQLKSSERVQGTGGSTLVKGESAPMEQPQEMEFDMTPLEKADAESIQPLLKEEKLGCYVMTPADVTSVEGLNLSVNEVPDANHVVALAESILSSDELLICAKSRRNMNTPAITVKLAYLRQAFFILFHQTGASAHRMVWRSCGVVLTRFLDRIEKEACVLRCMTVPTMVRLKPCQPLNRQDPQEPGPGPTEDSKDGIIPARSTASLTGQSILGGAHNPENLGAYVMSSMIALHLNVVKNYPSKDSREAILRHILYKIITDGVNSISSGSENADPQGIHVYLAFLRQCIFWVFPDDQDDARAHRWTHNVEYVKSIFESASQVGSEEKLLKLKRESATAVKMEDVEDSTVLFLGAACSEEELGATVPTVEQISDLNNIRDNLAGTDSSLVKKAAIKALMTKFFSEEDLVAIPVCQAMRGLPCDILKLTRIRHAFFWLFPCPNAKQHDREWNLCWKLISNAVREMVTGNQRARALLSVPRVLKSRRESLNETEGDASWDSESENDLPFFIERKAVGQESSRFRFLMENKLVLRKIKDVKYLRSSIPTNRVGSYVMTSEEAAWTDNLKRKATSDGWSAEQVVKYIVQNLYSKKDILAMYILRNQKQKAVSEVKVAIFRQVYCTVFPEYESWSTVWQMMSEVFEILKLAALQRPRKGKARKRPVGTFTMQRKEKAVRLNLKERHKAKDEVPPVSDQKKVSQVSFHPAFVGLLERFTYDAKIVVKLMMRILFTESELLNCERDINKLNKVKVKACHATFCDVFGQTNNDIFNTLVKQILHSLGQKEGSKLWDRWTEKQEQEEVQKCTNLTKYRADDPDKCSQLSGDPKKLCMELLGERVFDVCPRKLQRCTYIACKLLPLFFNKEERMTSNINGSKGMCRFDPKRMEVLKHTVFTLAHVSQSRRARTWELCYSDVDRDNLVQTHAYVEESRPIEELIKAATELVHSTESPTEVLHKLISNVMPRTSTHKGSPMRASDKMKAIREVFWNICKTPVPRKEKSWNIALWNVWCDGDTRPHQLEPIVIEDDPEDNEVSQQTHTVHQSCDGESMPMKSNANSADKSTKSHSDELKSKSKDADDLTKSNDAGEPTKSKDADDLTKSNDADEPTKSKDADDPTMLHEADDLTKPNDADEPTKSSDAEDGTKSNDADDMTNKPIDQATEWYVLGSVLIRLQSHMHSYHLDRDEVVDELIMHIFSADELLQCKTPSALISSAHGEVLKIAFSKLYKTHKNDWKLIEEFLQDRLDKMRDKLTSQLKWIANFKYEKSGNKPMPHPPVPNLSEKEDKLKDLLNTHFTASERVDIDTSNLKKLKLNKVTNVLNDFQQFCKETGKELDRKSVMVMIYNLTLRIQYCIKKTLKHKVERAVCTYVEQSLKNLERKAETIETFPSMSTNVLFEAVLQELTTVFQTAGLVPVVRLLMKYLLTPDDQQVLANTDASQWQEELNTQINLLRRTILKVMKTPAKQRNAVWSCIKWIISKEACLCPVRKSGQDKNPHSDTNMPVYSRKAVCQCVVEAFCSPEEQAKYWASRQRFDLRYQEITRDMKAMYFLMRNTPTSEQTYEWELVRIQKIHGNEVSSSSHQADAGERGKKRPIETVVLGEKAAAHQPQKRIAPSYSTISLPQPPKGAEQPAKLPVLIKADSAKNGLDQTKETEDGQTKPPSRNVETRPEQSSKAANVGAKHSVDVTQGYKGGEQQTHEDCSSSGTRVESPREEGGRTNNAPDVTLVRKTITVLVNFETCEKVCTMMTDEGGDLAHCQ